MKPLAKTVLKTVKGKPQIDKEMAAIRDDMQRTLRLLPIHGHTRNALMRRAERLATLAALRVTAPRITIQNVRYHDGDV